MILHFYARIDDATDSTTSMSEATEAVDVVESIENIEKNTVRKYCMMLRSFKNIDLS